MALVNVNRKNTDQFYRYKMPKLLAKVKIILVYFGIDELLVSLPNNPLTPRGFPINE